MLKKIAQSSRPQGSSSKGLLSTNTRRQNTDISKPIRLRFPYLVTNPSSSAESSRVLLLLLRLMGILLALLPVQLHLPSMTILFALPLIICFVLSDISYMYPAQASGGVRCSLPSVFSNHTDRFGRFDWGGGADPNNTGAPIPPPVTSKPASSHTKVNIGNRCICKERVF
jgi:hypothetical protein